MQSHSRGSIVELGARQLKSMHTYVEAAEGVEMPALKIYLLLCVFHQLRADCEKMTLGKQRRNKNTVTLYKSMQINKLFSDFLFFSFYPTVYRPCSGTCYTNRQGLCCTCVDIN